MSATLLPCTDKNVVEKLRMKRSFAPLSNPLESRRSGAGNFRLL